MKHNYLHVNLFKKTTTLNVSYANVLIKLSKHRYCGQYGLQLRSFTGL